eukprot:CAMPEP_0185571678 /NCGR_PEP_ID=MMETSP0434-20130131/3691_1 /TAXON_ID=626734 ORGANISM="Favella taraikaensis, Strain Fe Narragansett Bay" /NCGR_SAMPLE_ID=MMETSP0434 /ASSEMBLY_ACC=CAM_ASM_000379 /LENGTH=58 /DNA_ID=CAMNT_0028187219 /DNA_START=233 /DNA_END=409 /DNA_ORIENTATION=-
MSDTVYSLEQQNYDQLQAKQNKEALKILHKERRSSVRVASAERRASVQLEKDVALLQS